MPKNNAEGHSFSEALSHGILHGARSAPSTQPPPGVWLALHFTGMAESDGLRYESRHE